MSVMETIGQFLREEEVGFEQDDELKVIRFLFSNEAAGWTVTIHYLEDAAQIVVLSHLSSTVAEEFRSVVAEFVLRANCDLLVGGFDFGLDDGLVRFRTAMDIDDLDVTTQFVRNLIYSNVSTMDLHITALNRLAHGGANVAEAFQLLEANLQD